jgi:glucosylceramidase
MLADQQARFIGQHLGPAFRQEGIKTKIIVYDHNADRPDYPITVLSD